MSSDQKVDASILFVDDEEDILDIMSKVFRKSILNIHTASKGQDALKIIQNNNVDLVVLDLKMPGMDGLTL